MVQGDDSWKRDSSNSTATFSSLRSSWRTYRGSALDAGQEEISTGGNMATAAAFAQRRRLGNLKNKKSYTSIRSVESNASSTAESIIVVKKHRGSVERRQEPQSPYSFNGHTDRAREYARSQRTDSNTSKRSSVTSTKAKRRSADTVMQSGRHGNEWLFGGWSIRETVKGMLK